MTSNARPPEDVGGLGSLAYAAVCCCVFLAFFSLAVVFRGRSVKVAYTVDNRYLNSKECEFVDQVIQDITQFGQLQDWNNRLLVFPPLLSHYRFLIHNVTEDFTFLTSFSIGENESRRTVVCPQVLRVMSAKQQEVPDSHWNRRTSPGQHNRNPGNRHGAYQSTGEDDVWRSRSSPGNIQLDRKVRKKSPAVSSERVDGTESTDRTREKRSKARRPAQELYVPRALRQRQQEQDTESQPQGEGVSKQPLNPDTTLKETRKSDRHYSASPGRSARSQNERRQKQEHVKREGRNEEKRSGKSKEKVKERKSREKHHESRSSQHRQKNERGRELRDSTCETEGQQKQEMQVISDNSDFTTLEKEKSAFDVERIKGNVEGDDTDTVHSFSDRGVQQERINQSDGKTVRDAGEGVTCTGVTEQSVIHGNVSMSGKEHYQHCMDSCPGKVSNLITGQELKIVISEPSECDTVPDDHETMGEVSKIDIENVPKSDSESDKGFGTVGLAETEVEEKTSSKSCQNPVRTSHCENKTDSEHSVNENDDSESRELNNSGNQNSVETTVDSEKVADIVSDSCHSHGMAAVQDSMSETLHKVSVSQITDLKVELETTDAATTVAADNRDRELQDTELRTEIEKLGDSDQSETMLDNACGLNVQKTNMPDCASSEEKMSAIQTDSQEFSTIRGEKHDDVEVTVTDGYEKEKLKAASGSDLPKVTESAADHKDTVSMDTNESVPMEINDAVEEEEDEESWDAMFDDSGECLNDELKKELSKEVKKTKKKKIVVQKPEYDYYNYQPKTTLITLNSAM
ncbi:protein starmaker-like [Ptychodera flava]|uniref:protein starmaker-like n=1 Tax=Ptychodera flava TaxID=63121 RepID=UPI00396A8B94